MYLNYMDVTTYKFQILSVVFPPKHNHESINNDIYITLYVECLVYKRKALMPLNYKPEHSERSKKELGIGVDDFLDMLFGELGKNTNVGERSKDTITNILLDLLVVVAKDPGGVFGVGVVFDYDPMGDGIVDESGLHHTPKEVVTVDDDFFLGGFTHDARKESSEDIGIRLGLQEAHTNHLGSVVELHDDMGEDDEVGGDDLVVGGEGIDLFDESLGVGHGRAPFWVCILVVDEWWFESWHLSGFPFDEQGIHCPGKLCHPNSTRGTTHDDGIGSRGKYTKR
jgi:hypothetical protein